MGVFFWNTVYIACLPSLGSDSSPPMTIFVLKWDVKLQLTDSLWLLVVPRTTEVITLRHCGTMGKTENVCLSVCFFVPYVRPQFWAHLDQIWRVASVYPLGGHGPVSERHLRPQARAVRAVYILAPANGCQALSGNLRLAGGRRNGPSATGASIQRCRREE